MPARPGGRLIYDTSKMKRTKKQVIIRLGAYLGKYKFHMLLGLVLSIAGNMLALVGPKLSGLALDSMKPGTGKVDFESLFGYVSLMLLFYAISYLMSYGLARLMIHISRRVVFQMRQDVFQKLMRLPVWYFDTHQTGDIISKMSYDIDTINTSLSNDLIQVLASMITVAGSFLMMLTISPVLCLVFVFTVPLSILISRWMVKRTRPLFRKRSEKLGEMNGFVEEMISGLKTIKGYNREEYTINKFDSRNQEAVDAYYKAEFMGGLQRTVHKFRKQHIPVADQRIGSHIVHKKQDKPGEYFLLRFVFKEVFRANKRGGKYNDRAAVGPCCGRQGLPAA